RRRQPPARHAIARTPGEDAGTRVRLSCRLYPAPPFRDEDGNGRYALRVFGRLPVTGQRGCTEAGVRKASREETAGGVRTDAGVDLWGIWRRCLIRVVGSGQDDG